MKFTASQIAEFVSGEVEGDKGVKIDKLSKIEEGDKGSLTFLGNPKYNSYLYTTKSSITIVNKDFVDEKPYKTTLVRVSDPYAAFSKLLHKYNHIKMNKSGISKTAKISEKSNISEDSYIGDFVVIGEGTKIKNKCEIHSNVFIGNNVYIGKNTSIHSGTRILDNTVIGENCEIHNNVVIGADGFGWTVNKKGEYEKVPQTGNVIIGNNVDIGANTTIDKATLGSTKINDGVKLDNLIQIAHNVEIGKNTVIAAQSGVAGSTKIGKNCKIGGQVGISGHLNIGDGVSIQAKSGVLKNVASGKKFMGYPAFDYMSFNKSYVHFKNLGKYIKELDVLKNIINDNE
jgi:UDP-3-O-[3-hydroxymyristoyl] glucosamine N-acyltransferase